MLVAFYIPYGIVVAMAHVNGYSPSYNLAVRVTITLALLNAYLNTILYCWRIKEHCEEHCKTMVQLLWLKALQFFITWYQDLLYIRAGTTRFSDI